MDEIRIEIGGIVELQNNQKYQIVDLLDIKNRKYLLCASLSKPIKPVIIEYKYSGNEILYRLENDKKTLLEVYTKAYKNSKKWCFEIILK